jgi:hypothetical protein
MRDQEPPPRPQRNDQGNARRLVRRFSDRLRYHPSRRAWWVRDHEAQPWRPDTTCEVNRLCRVALREEIAGEIAAALGDDDQAEADELLAWQRESLTWRRIRAAVEQASLEPALRLRTKRVGAGRGRRR